MAKAFECAGGYAQIARIVLLCRLSHQQRSQRDELSISQRLGEDVRYLFSCIDVLNRDCLVEYKGSEVVILQRDVFSAWSNSGTGHKVDASFVVFEDCAVYCRTIILEYHDCL